MFRDKFQQQRLSIFYACGSAPLELWEMQVRNGNIRRIVDAEVNSLALEIIGTNVSTTYISSPKNPKGSLGICLPFLIMVIKNMHRYFTFEITILDDQNMHRRFRASNFQSVTRVRPFGIAMPICLHPGWNQVQFDLAEFTRRAYGTNYVETTRMQIHANCRIRRVYFSDRLYEEEELPDEYRLFFPSNKPAKGSKDASQLSIGRLSRTSRFSRRHNELEDYGEESLGPSIDSRTVVTPEQPHKLKIHVPFGEYADESNEVSQRGSEVESESVGSPRDLPASSDLPKSGDDGPEENEDAEVSQGVEEWPRFMESEGELVVTEENDGGGEKGEEGYEIDHDKEDVGEGSDV